jgi:hypothetical protein
MATRRLEKSRPSPLLLNGKSFSLFHTFFSPMSATRTRVCGAERCVCHAGLVWCLLQGSFEQRGPGGGRHHPGVLAVMWSHPLPTVERLQHLPCLTAAEALLARQQCLHMQTSISTSLIRAARHDPYLTSSTSLASDHKQRNATRRWPRRLRTSDKLNSKRTRKCIGTSGVGT